MDKRGNIILMIIIIVILISFSQNNLTGKATDENPTRNYIYATLNWYSCIDNGDSINAGYRRFSFSGKKFVFKDACLSEGKLRDYSCDGRKPYYIDVNCENGCEDGKCISEKQIFKHVATLEADKRVLAVASADLDKDGYDDALLAGRSGEEVYIYLSKGDGTFKSPLKYPTGKVTESITIEDINNDGNLDLILPSFLSQKLHVYFGNGDGSFTLSKIYDSPIEPNSAAVGDFNGDGIKDIVVAGEGEGSLFAMFFGEGNGIFKERIESTPARTYYWWIEAADFDNDGIDEMVAKKDINSLVILKSASNGKLSITKTFTNILTQDMSIGDVNKDGLNDILLSGVDAQTFDEVLIVYINEGNFEFTKQTYPKGTAGHSEIGDFNNDGNLDVITVSFYSMLENDKFIIHFGNPDGTFKDAIEQTVSNRLRGKIASGDFNGDGYDDVIVGSYLQNLTSGFVYFSNIL